MFCIYKATSPSGKIYIGMTTQSFEERKRQHKRHAKRGSNIFHKAILRYGFENFNWEILYKTNDLDDLGKKETELITKYNSTNKRVGYNQKLGGQIGWKHSRETRQKMSLAKLGKPCHWDTSKVKIKIKAFRGEYLVGSWDSLTDCSKALNIDQGNISKYLKLNKPLKGFTFEKIAI